ncbi:hypothetical protein [Planctomycetes bacterium CA13]
MSTSLLSDEAPVDPDDELLVAYVDGELDSPSRNELEERLLRDDSLRRRLQELQEGWDLLDNLATATPNEKLVESTMELVVADLVAPKIAKPGIASAYRLPLMTAAACIAGILATIGVIWAIRNHNYQSQLADLAIAENIDAYYYGSDLQLMRDLAINESWSKMILAMQEIGDVSTHTPLVAATDLDEREKQIANLPLADRAQLDSRWKRFTRLAPEDQQRLRETAEAVRRQPQPERLLETMQAYAGWRETLSSDLRDQIKNSDIDQRRDVIRQAIDESQLALSRQSGAILSDETIERIDYALHRILHQRLAQKIPNLIDFRSRIKKFFSPDAVDMASIGAMVANDPGRTDRRSSGRLGLLRGVSDRPDPLSHGELAMIESMLTDADREMLDMIAGNPRDPFIESETLRFWAEETLRRKMPWREEDPRTLIERYEQIDDPEYRETLDLLPPKAMLDRLTPERHRP